MTLKKIIDEELTQATSKDIMLQVQNLTKIQQSGKQTEQALQNNPDLQKSFATFQQLVAQQLKQKQLEAQQAQQREKQIAQQQAQAQQATQQQTTTAAGTTPQAAGAGTTTAAN